MFKQANTKTGLKNTMVKVLILAGGAGERLWPLSRKKWPKFMLKFSGGKSLLQLAYERTAGIVPPKERYIVTSAESEFLIRRDISINGGGHSAGSGLSAKNIISEPLAKNTAPAIMLGIFNSSGPSAFKDEDIVIVLPADHIIEPKDVFKKTLKDAIEVARNNYIVAIGIKPSYPATGYGYIKAKLKVKSQKSKVYKVEEFKEKPDKESAKKYIKSGNYYWNAGIFVFKAGVMREEIKNLCPDIWDNFNKLKRDRSNLLDIYEKLPNISIDYAVMEKTDKAAIVVFEGKRKVRCRRNVRCRWNDLGCWEAVADVFGDVEGPLPVVINGESEIIDSRDSFIYTKKGKLAACIGIKDIIVIDTDDAILIMKKGQGQKVKDMVSRLKDKPITKYHLTDYRPWGGYKVLESGKNYKIKILEILPGERLSLQKHKYRDEIWTVIEGIALITLGEKDIKLKKGETIKIPCGTAHRAENISKSTLKILELATGKKIFEDDIIRLSDDYDR